jgi:hypothetical protein
MLTEIDYNSLINDFASQKARKSIFNDPDWGLGGPWPLPAHKCLCPLR